MIDRYTRPEMGALWSDESKFNTWLEVELAVCEAQARAGIISPEIVQDIKKKAKFDLKRIAEIEADVKHDVIAFLTSVAENVGENSRFVHMGLTSSDVVDTSLALLLVKASKIIKRELDTLYDAVLLQARKHRHTITIGRSHGIHAEPTTFGFKLAVWLAELDRHKHRLNEAIENIRVGQISGPVGTYSNISPEIEAATCEILGLKPALISTQIIQRDRHAQFVWTLAAIGSSLDKFATEIRHLQRTDVLEAEEPFSAKQKGSSAMPHKRNPVGSENISGLARVLRANSLAALENIVLWHERDISHSSVERVIMPDSTILIDYMLARFSRIMKDLVVYPENMIKNADVFGGVVYSQAVLLKLIEKGLSREQAYAIVQENAMKAWNNPSGNFKQNLVADAKVKEHLSKDEVEECFNHQNYLKNIDTVLKRLNV